VQTKIVIADFTKGSQVYEHIEKETADVPISILGKYNSNKNINLHCTL